MGKLPTKEVAIAIKDKLHHKYELDDNDCWRWTGCTTRGGYGLLTYKYSNYYTHRLMAALYFPEFEETHHIMHWCDIRVCMSPEHLILGSILLNNQDMFEKRRARPRGLVPESYKGIYYDQRGNNG